MIHVSVLWAVRGVFCMHRVVFLKVGMDIGSTLR